MPRPKRTRWIEREPVCRCFCPQDGHSRQPTVVLTLDEYETIRLIDLENCDQASCAARMGLSRASVQSIYDGARKKLAEALVRGSSLRIEDGDCFVYDGESPAGSPARNRTGGISMVMQNNNKENGKMVIAVSYDREKEEIFQHFGKTEYFKLYEIEDNTVKKSDVVSTDGQGHGALAGVLKKLRADVLICGGIGGGAQAALAEAGIRLFGGCSGNADAAVDAFLKGNLSYQEDIRCDHHDHGDGGCGDHGHGEGGHACCYG
ncbi:DUF134 domain-containing protein [Lachnoclostridium sp. Marseille-P6806]|uniref:DUF134 domain-containing protein n=1 Tax=Lachnoclostridium sp. Marseille-P6806 TaxID=2364793 RepID=UPI001030593F|nr:DUF134 domain-containing protein [Lachnoclostridium sp. Marseille-P6806]